MYTTIYLTRHGQTEWNIEKRLQGRGNSPLTHSGIERAEELRDRLEGISIDVIYSSPIERALSTANLLKGNKEIEIILHEGLMEMCFGEYEGRITEEVMRENPEWDIDAIMHGNTQMCAPGGETLGSVRRRAADAMEEIIARHQGEKVLIVTHGITLKALMHYFEDEAVNNEVMGQATLTEIHVDQEGNRSIIMKNDGSHFTVREEKSGW